MKKTILGIVIAPLLAFASSANSDYVVLVSKQHNSYDVSDNVTPNPDPDVPDESSQAWMTIPVSTSLSNFVPSLFDGSHDGHAQYFFNFGQSSFVGDPKGYDNFLAEGEYNKSNWTNCAITVFDGNDYCALTYNNGVAFYNKSHTSGKYYFEITAKNQATIPYLDAIGLANKTSFSFNNILGAHRVGGFDNAGYNFGNGSGTNVDYKNTGSGSEGTVYQVWLDYDERKMAVMVNGTVKTDYVNYFSKP